VLPVEGLQATTPKRDRRSQSKEALNLDDLIPRRAGKRKLSRSEDLEALVSKKLLVDTTPTRNRSQSLEPLSEKASASEEDLNDREFRRLKRAKLIADNDAELKLALQISSAMASPAQTDTPVTPEPPTKQPNVKKSFNRQVSVSERPVRVTSGEDWTEEQSPSVRRGGRMKLLEATADELGTAGPENSLLSAPTTPKKISRRKSFSEAYEGLGMESSIDSNRRSGRSKGAYTILGRMPVPSKADLDESDDLLVILKEMRPRSFRSIK
jgi:hypothetical protein